MRMGDFTCYWSGAARHELGSEGVAFHVSCPSLSGCWMEMIGCAVFSGSEPAPKSSVDVDEGAPSTDGVLNSSAYKISLPPQFADCERLPS
jgi:hypothetical protein